jgi:large-conductance mechanosensitive channel
MLLSLLDINKFKQFISDNTIIGTTIGVIVAYATWDFIKSLVGDIIIPGLFFVLINPFIKKNIISTIFAPIQKLDIPQFIQKFLSFIIVIILVIIIINYLIHNNWGEFIKTKSHNTLETQTIYSIHDSNQYSYN